MQDKDYIASIFIKKRKKINRNTADLFLLLYHFLQMPGAVV